MSSESQNDAIRILVVDDSALMRNLLQDTLREAGFQALTAVDGMDAWESLQRESVHLVLADVNMPRMDGLELTRLIRADARLGALPIILISASGTDEDRRLGTMHGANAFVTKERRDLDSLADRITRLLGG